MNEMTREDIPYGQSCQELLSGFIRSGCATIAGLGNGPTTHPNEIALASSLSTIIHRIEQDVLSRPAERHEDELASLIADLDQILSRAPIPDERVHVANLSIREMIVLTMDRCRRDLRAISDHLIVEKLEGQFQ